MLVRIQRMWIPLLIFISVIIVLAYRSWPATVREGRDQLGFSSIEDAKRPHQVIKTFTGQSEFSISPQSESVISNSTLGFQKVFAINLPARTDKRDALVLTSKITGFKIDFIDGVDPSTVSKLSIPSKITSKIPIAGGHLGSWRAHLNFLVKVVQDGLTTALVLEDDVDWDVRLLQQLKDLAKMTNAIFDGSTQELQRIKFDDLVSTQLLQSQLQSDFPYGTGWDVLLLGNCGVDIDINKTHVVHSKDETVPDLSYLHIYGDLGNLRLNAYPTRARIVGYAIEQTCTYAYAVTQQAARRLLLDLGLERLDNPFDIMLRDWCEGKYPEQGPPHKCIGVLPSLFESYRRAGPADGDSDIDGDRDHIGFRAEGGTPNIRKSVRMNLRKLLDGETELEDQYPNLTFGREAASATVTV